MKKIVLTSAILLTLANPSAEEGVRWGQITLGSVLALDGPAKGLGTGMREGINAALKGQKVKGKSVKVLYENDNYEPKTAKVKAKKLLDKGVFAFIGNVGTPTAKVVLPQLQDKGVPAVGFFTGAGLLRPGSGLNINFRASYAEETASIIADATKNGIPPKQMCAYVQNDAYGMAGVKGILRTMQFIGAKKSLIKKFEQIIAMEGENPKRNGVGPVGVYKRNTMNVREGIESLKKWEKENKTKCSIVVTVGAYTNIAKFVGQFNRDGKRLISAVSFTGAENFSRELAKYNATKNVAMTQVVPLPSASMPIIEEAKEALGTKFSIVSLEGYIVGKLFLRILSDIPGKISRQAFLAQAKKSRFNLGGVDIDFTKNKHQASSLVIKSYLNDSKVFVNMDDRIWERVLADIN